MPIVVFCLGYCVVTVAGLNQHLAHRGTTQKLVEWMALTVLNTASEFIQYSAGFGLEWCTRLVLLLKVEPFNRLCHPKWLLVHLLKHQSPWCNMGLGVFLMCVMLSASGVPYSYQARSSTSCPNHMIITRIHQFLPFRYDVTSSAHCFLILLVHYWSTLCKHL